MRDCVNCMDIILRARKHNADGFGVINIERALFQRNLSGLLQISISNCPLFKVFSIVP